MNDAKGIEITELEIIKEISVAEMNYILEKRRWKKFSRTRIYIIREDKGKKIISNKMMTQIPAAIELN